MPLRVDGIEGGDIEGQPPDERRKVKWLGWLWLGTPFRLELDVTPNYTNDDFVTAKLCLFVDNIEVMVLDVSRQLRDEYFSWRFFGVSALKAGPWMAQLNDLAGQLHVAERQSVLDRERSFYGGKAGKIELD